MGAAIWVGGARARARALPLSGRRERRPRSTRRVMILQSQPSPPFSNVEIRRSIDDCHRRSTIPHHHHRHHRLRLRRHFFFFFFYFLYLLSPTITIYLRRYGVSHAYARKTGNMRMRFSFRSTREIFNKAGYVRPLRAKKLQRKRNKPTECLICLTYKPSQNSQ